MTSENMHEWDPSLEVIPGLDAAFNLAFRKLQNWQNSKDAREIADFGKKHPHVFNLVISAGIGGKKLEGAISDILPSSPVEGNSSPKADNPSPSLEDRLVGGLQKLPGAAGDAVEMADKFKENMEPGKVWDLKPYLADKFQP